MAQKVNLDVAERLDITCRRGDSFSLSLTLKDSTGTAIDLGLEGAGYSFLFDVKGAKETQSNGSVVRPVVASSSSNVSKIYDVQQNDGTSTTTILKGNFRVNEDISD